MNPKKMQMKFLALVMFFMFAFMSFRVDSVLALTVLERISAVAQSFRDAPEVALGESTTLVYAYSFADKGAENRQHVGTILPIFYWGVLSADGGILSGDLEDASKEIGIPLLGGSIHADRFLSLMFPELKTLFEGFVPGTAKKLVWRMQVGVCIAHDFTTQQTLKSVYAGPKFNF